MCLIWFSYLENYTVTTSDGSLVLPRDTYSKPISNERMKERSLVSPGATIGHTLQHTVNEVLVSEVLVMGGDTYFI